MLSKITIPSLALASSMDAFVLADTFNISNESSDRATLQKLRNTPHHPRVLDGDCADSGAAVTRLKKGPANIPELEYAGDKYVDSDFTAPNSLFWDGYETTSSEDAYDTALADSTYEWKSYTSVSAYATNPLFYGSTVSYLEPN
jgi:hypothetical protein